MAHSNSPETAPEEAPERPRKRYRTVLLKLLIIKLLILMLITLVLVWATVTTAGAIYTLNFLNYFTGIQVQGVSGSLIRQLTIQRVELHNNNVDLVADDVELQWQPNELWQRRIQLDYVRIKNLKLAISSSKEQDNVMSIHFPESLKLPQPIKFLKADQLAVDHLQITLLQANLEPAKPQQFSALKANVVIDATNYQLQFSGTTPWGSATLKGGFETANPFKTQAQFEWLGLANKHSGATLPATDMHGTVSGSWEKLLVQAQVNAALDSAALGSAVLGSKQADQKITSVSGRPGGQIHVVLTPFNNLPVEALKLDLNSVNPASFYTDAPKANLRVIADFNVTEDKKSPTLSGYFSIKNTLPMTWDSGGIPVTKLSSEVTMNEHQLGWKTSKIELEDGGSATSSGHLNWVGKDGSAPSPAHFAHEWERAGERARETGGNLDSCSGCEKKDTKKNGVSGVATTLSPTLSRSCAKCAGEGAKLPEIIGSVELKNVNLLRIDTRLKKTQLNGTIQAESEKTGLQFALNVHDIQSKKSDTKLTVDVHLSHEQVVNVKKLELRAQEATLTAQGTVALHDKQQFLLQGEAHNLNPARWITVPEGRIATRFNVTGQLNQGWRVDAKVTELSGQFAGLNLQGESDVVAQQDKLISIKKLEFNWGKNHLSAKGNWQSGALSSVQNEHDQLRFNLALPDLGALSEPFKKIMPDVSNEKFQGSLFVDGILTGNSKQPGGQLNLKADNTRIPGVIELKKLQATVALAGGAHGKMEGNLDATELIIGGSPTEENDGFAITHLQAGLSGLRHAHQFNVNATLPRKYQVKLQATGDVQEPRSGGAQWKGEVQQFDLSGPSDLQLTSPFTLQIASDAVQMGPANWQGKLGKLQIQQLIWSHGQLKTKGQLQGLPVVNALKLWRARLPLFGDLQIDAGWDFTIGQQADGQFEIKRTSGDLTVQDVSGGYSQTFALGLQNLLVTGRIGQTGVSAAAQQPVDVQLQVQGSQLGQIEGNLRSTITRTKQGWSVSANAPLSGTAKMQINDIQWLSQLAGSGVTLRGELQAQAQLAGTMEKPTYAVQVNGKELQVALTELGMLLPNGILDASIEKNLVDTQFKLNKLRFSQTIKVPRSYQNLRGQLTGLAELAWLNETGFVEASGVIDLQSGRGSIATHWQRFPFLQTEESWLVASGEAQLTESEKLWSLTGQLIADAAYFSTPKQAPPQLSSDVVVLKKNEKRNVTKSAGVQTNVDFNIKTGNNFVFVGRGLTTRLMGDIRVRIQNDGPVYATGSIQTVGGTYEGYGQQLAIERGILNFQGALDNPTLNVRALRRGLPVEAGVEVVGTVAKPEVRLISQPNVPDQDKLSWMILGRGSDQTSGSDAGLLLTAANAIWGGDSGSNIPRKIAQTLGLDDISVSSSSSSPESQLPSQTVAGSINNNNMATDQIFSVGKNITPDLVFSIERSLTDATNGIKLTWKLTRRFSVVVRAGSDTSLDGQYLFSFD